MWDENEKKFLNFAVKLKQPKLSFEKIYFEIMFYFEAEEGLRQQATGNMQPATTLWPKCKKFIKHLITVWILKKGSCGCFISSFSQLKNYINLYERETIMNEL